MQLCETYPAPLGSGGDWVVVGIPLRLPVRGSQGMPPLWEETLCLSGLCSHDGCGPRRFLEQASVRLQAGNQQPPTAG